MPDWDMNGDATIHAMRAQARYAVQTLADVERQRDEANKQSEYNAAVAAKLADQVNELLAALKGVVRVADRKTVEFDAARVAIAKVEGR